MFRVRISFNSLPNSDPKLLFLLTGTMTLFRQYIVTQMCDSTSKQNLETIVEAIRHLEGDHLFSEESGPHQVAKEPHFLR
jgi:hypothetical protein